MVCLYLTCSPRLGLDSETFPIPDNLKVGGNSDSRRQTGRDSEIALAKCQKRIWR